MYRKTLLVRILELLFRQSNGSSLSQTAHWVESYNYLQGTVSKQFGHKDMFLCFVLSEKAVGNA